MAMNIDFTGKTVLVTGGGRGLGKEMALQFAGCGANVYIANRKEDQGHNQNPLSRYMFCLTLLIFYHSVWKCQCL